MTLKLCENLKTRHKGVLVDKKNVIKFKLKKIIVSKPEMKYFISQQRRNNHFG